MTARAMEVGLGDATGQGHVVLVERSIACGEGMGGSGGAAGCEGGFRRGVSSSELIKRRNLSLGSSGMEISQSRCGDRESTSKELQHEGQ